MDGEAVVMYASMNAENVYFWSFRCQQRVTSPKYVDGWYLPHQRRDSGARRRTAIGVLAPKSLTSTATAGRTLSSHLMTMLTSGTEPVSSGPQFGDCKRLDHPLRYGACTSTEILAGPRRH